MSTKIIIVRHAQAEGNIKRYFQGHTDGPISEGGFAQLDALAARFESIDFQAIYSSPLKRAYMTAEACNRRLKLPIHTDERLMEINGGVLEGVPWADFPKLYPEQAKFWDSAPHLFRPEGGESVPEVIARMSAAVCDIAARHEGETVVVATHGCAIRCLMSWAKGLPAERINEVAWWDNTAIGIIEITDGNPKLLEENDCGHITEELSTFAKQRWWKTPGEMVFDD